MPYDIKDLVSYLVISKLLIDSLIHVVFIARVVRI
jgi:hypothetical protein